MGIDGCEDVGFHKFSVLGGNVDGGGLELLLCGVQLAAGSVAESRAAFDLHGLEPVVVQVLLEQDTGLVNQSRVGLELKQIKRELAYKVLVCCNGH